MLIVEAIILGMLQGLTEFLPISSSAHLTLLPELLGWKNPLLCSLTFDVALHIGTLVAVVGYFRRDIYQWFGWLGRGALNFSFWKQAEPRVLLWLIVGTIPAVIAALLWQKQIETVFRAPQYVAMWLIGFGLLMGAAERFCPKSRELSSMTWWDSLGIGIAQALSIMPGVSRSGSTITAGMALRFSREEAARFSFMLSIPALTGAVLLELKKIIHVTQDQSVVVLVAGILASAVSGYFCIQFLLAYLKRHPIYIFTLYRVALGVFVLGWVYFHKP